MQDAKAVSSTMTGDIDLGATNKSILSKSNSQR